MWYVIGNERKPTESQGASNCAHVGHAERKSSYSSNPSGSAVVSVNDDHLISLRNDNLVGQVPAELAGPVLFTPDGWRVALPTFGDYIPAGDGLYYVSGDEPAGVSVAFTPSEWRAFVAGVDAGEFTLNEEGFLPTPARL